MQKWRRQAQVLVRQVLTFFLLTRLETWGRACPAVMRSMCPILHGLAFSGKHGRGCQYAGTSRLKQWHLAVHAGEDLRGLWGLCILVSQLEQVAHVFCLEKALLARVSQYLRCMVCEDCNTAWCEVRVADAMGLAWPLLADDSVHSDCPSCTSLSFPQAEQS